MLPSSHVEKFMYSLLWTHSFPMMEWLVYQKSLQFINLLNVPYILYRPYAFLLSSLYELKQSSFNPWWLPLIPPSLPELCLQLHLHSGKLLHWPWESTFSVLCWSYWAVQKLFFKPMINFPEITSLLIEHSLNMRNERLTVIFSEILISSFL